MAILDYLDWILETYFMSGQTNNKQISSYIALGATRQYTSHSYSLVRVRFCRLSLEVEHEMCVSNFLVVIELGSKSFLY